ncbi:hypothetical protein H1S01_11505 [Heliobacterium chlorum]|uniref:Uncharacterized protein n=1 Tax=Heliobacterium chlorum TaxID=2698 RepID=A0ABR7T2Y6_HELCL|nr:hypothetical protein [Heliobacterium chlorum]MBC9785134.1 hypothetical protein [Heliobacterium chlorum]
MNAQNDYDFHGIRQNLEHLCLNGEICTGCEKNRCLVFFSKKVADYAMNKNVFTIPQGCSMIPKQDLKTYHEDELIESLSLVLQQCKDCRDNHDDDCSVNLIRTSLEYALFGDSLAYRGSTTIYFIDAHNANNRIGKLLKDKFMESKNK